LSQPKAGWLTC